MKIAIGCDHGGLCLKSAVKEVLNARHIEIIDKGTDTPESVDYPVYGLAVAEAVASGEADLGIVLCGTGIGISIAANKVKGIRAGVATNVFMAQATREHNNANVLALGGRVVSPDEAKAIVTAWLDAEYQGGRHQRRIDEITAIEEKYFK